MTFTIDRSPSSEVWVCSCQIRGIALDHLQALRAMRAHEREHHPGENHAGRMLKSYVYVQRHADLGLL